jgi:hypothetical protein
MEYGLEKVFKNTRKHGLQIMGGGKSSITSRTSKNTFEVLKEDPCTFSNYVEVQATWMFFQRSAHIIKLYSLSISCMIIGFHVYPLRSFTWSG